MAWVFTGLRTLLGFWLAWSDPSCPGVVLVGPENLIVVDLEEFSVLDFTGLSWNFLRNFFCPGFQWIYSWSFKFLKGSTSYREPFWHEVSEVLIFRSKKNYLIFAIDTNLTSAKHFLKHFLWYFNFLFKTPPKI